MVEENESQQFVLLKVLQWKPYFLPLLLLKWNYIEEYLYYVAEVNHLTIAATYAPCATYVEIHWNDDPISRSSKTGFYWTKRTLTERYRGKH